MLSLCYNSTLRVCELELRRAYALIDVLRNADLTTTPLDMIYLYLSYTEPTCSLRDILFSRLNTTCEDSYRRAALNGIIIPKGLTTMATRYLTRCCKAHVRSIAMMTSYYNFWTQRDATGWEVSECYPVAVGQALDRFDIPQYAELREVKHLIDALHAAVCPVLTKQLCEEYRLKKVPLTRKQSGKIQLLYNLLMYTIGHDSACFDSYTRNTLCNLLEILLVLDARGCDYMKSLCCREVQDFSRTSAEDRGTLVASPDTVIPIQNQFRTASNGIDRSLAVLSKLSTQAALCLGTGVDSKAAMGFYVANDIARQCSTGPFLNLLDTLNNSSRETYLYVKYELMTEQVQLELMQEKGMLCTSNRTGREE